MHLSIWPTTILHSMDGVLCSPLLVFNDCLMNVYYALLYCRVTRVIKTLRVETGNEQ